MVTHFSPFQVILPLSYASTKCESAPRQQRMAVAKKTVNLARLSCRGVRMGFILNAMIDRWFFNVKVSRSFK